MADTKTFYQVDCYSEYYNTNYDTLDKAQERARANAWRQGQDYYVLKSIAVAKAPELVKNITIDTVKDQS